VVEEEDIFIPGLSRLVKNMVLHVVVPPWSPLGHGVSGIALAQGPTPGTGRAARNAALLRTLRAIGRSRKWRYV